MMSFSDEMAGRLPAGMKLPEEFRALFDWMEAHGFLMASRGFVGDRLGLLGTEDDLQAGRVTAILFRVETSEQAHETGEAWFRGAVPNVAERLVAFGHGFGSRVAVARHGQA